MSGQQPVPALSQLPISVGLGPLVPVFPFLCPPARCFWLGTSWEPPGSMPQPCFLPLPVSSMPGNDSIMSPEEQSLKLSRCYHSSSCRHPLCCQSQTLWLSQPGKANSCIGCLFYSRFSFSNLAEQSHSCAFLLMHLVQILFFFSREGAPGWLLGTGTGASGSLSHTQGDVLGLIPSTRPVYSLQNTPVCRETCLAINITGISSLQN